MWVKLDWGGGKEAKVGKKMGKADLFFCKSMQTRAHVSRLRLNCKALPLIQL